MLRPEVINKVINKIKVINKVIQRGKLEVINKTKIIICVLVLNFLKKEH